jgi:pyruvate dehydrogenase E2 component (dihydrolipoamide acetyltransferase)
MADFLMPALGADMETGKVVQWMVRQGDRVRPGDVVAVVETHKGAIDVEIFLDGVIDGLAPIGAELRVGAVLAHVHAPDAAGAPTPITVPATAPPPGATPISVAPAQASRAAASAAPAGARLRISPVARRRVQELGLAIEALHGTGIDAAITLADVELAAATPAVRRQRGFDPAQMRQAIAVAMSRSKREIPHYYLTATLDLDAASRWLEAYNAERAPDARLLPAALLLKASAKALADVPHLNGFFEGGAFRPGAGIHVGWAIALRGGGLVAPAIHDADRKSLPELMAALRELVTRARSGGLRSSELTDPTITVTSLGERGAESVLGVIYPPQVAIVGFGRIVERPWVVDGAIRARPLVALSLAADHRASDGHMGGRLLAAIDHALQSPETL